MGSPGNLPRPGIKPVSSALAGGFYTTEPLGKPQQCASPTHTTRKTDIWINGTEKREPRNQLTHVWLIDLQQKRQEYPMGKRQSL